MGSFLNCLFESSLFCEGVARLGMAYEAGLFAIEEQMEIDETIADSKDAKGNCGGVCFPDVADA